MNHALSSIREPRKIRLLFPLFLLLSSCTLPFGLPLAEPWPEGPTPRGPAALPRNGAPSAGNSFNILLGGRVLDESQWAPLDDQGVFGVEGSFAPGTSPLEIQMGLMFAGSGEDSSIFGQTIELDARILETYFGLGASLKPESVPLRLHAGAGLSLIATDLEGSSGFASVSDSDSTGGVYFKAGVSVLLSDHTFLGFDARFVSGTEVNLFGVDSDVDYSQVALIFGWVW